MDRSRRSRFPGSLRRCVWPARSSSGSRERADVTDAGPHVLSQPGGCDRGAAGAAGLDGRVRPGRQGEGCHDGERVRPFVAGPRQGRRMERIARRRQRTASLRLERLFQRPARNRRNRPVSSPRRSASRTAASPSPGAGVMAGLVRKRGTQDRPIGPAPGRFFTWPPQRRHVACIRAGCGGDLVVLAQSARRGGAMAGRRAE